MTQKIWHKHRENKRRLIDDFEDKVGKKDSKKATHFNSGLYDEMLQETQEYTKKYGKIKINEAINIYIKLNLIDFNQTIENLQNEHRLLKMIVDKLNKEYFYSAVYTVMCH